MPPVPSDPTLGERFSKVARAEVSAATAASWDSSLARDPALLVPVALQALVVPRGGQVEHALVGSVIPEGKGKSEDAPDASPRPFSDGTARAPGVYLRIALPDGLMHGTVAEGGELELPRLPDRWAVLRLDSGAANKRRLHARVMQSDHRVVDDLPQFREGRHKPGQAYIPPELLTAAVGGDLAWTTVFDSAQNRFSLFDDLGGRPVTAPLTYVVVGWYSRPHCDPLHPSSSQPAFDELLRELGWIVDEARLEAARAEAVRLAQAAADTLALDSHPLTVAGVDTAVAVGDERVDVPATDVPTTILEGAGQVDSKVEPWRPQRTIFHGALFGVFPDGGTGGDPRPAAQDVRVAIGGTASESLARMVAGALGDDESAAERLQTAFGYDLTDTFDKLDGVPRLEEELHLRGFHADAGDRREETVRAGDPLTEAPGSAPRVDEPAEGGGRGHAKTRLEFTQRRYDGVLDTFARQTRPESFDPPPDPPRTEVRVRSGPRRYHPVDPAIVVRGLGRTLLHGYDGEFEPDERLACRLSGDPISGFAGLIQGAHLLENRIEHGGLPREVEQLLHEAVLEDPLTTDQTAAVAASLSASQNADAVRRRIRGERQLMLRSQLFHSDAPRLTAASIKDGVEPSPVAVGIWSRPWEPRFLEWRLALAVDGDMSRWELGEIDLAPRAGSDAAGTLTLEVAGRTLLTSTGAKALAERVNRFLEDEDRLDAAGMGNVEEGTEDLLRRLCTGAQFYDLLGGALDGLREHLLGFDTNLGDFVAFGTEPSLPPPTGAPQLVRGGIAKVAELRVVDAFGRVLDLDPGSVLPSETLRPPGADPGAVGQELFLAPRVLPLAKLDFRFLDADDDGAEATIDQGEGGRSPVAGFVHPDLVDGALEFFDTSGAALGQLRHEWLGGGVTWESAPGTPAEFGAPPSASIPNSHLGSLATALVERDAADRAAGTQRSESPLSALLRIVDTTLWTADQIGHVGNEHTALLVGRPIAVVRAELRLEVESDLDEYGASYPGRAARESAYAELARTAFDVRLGALTRMEDGLLGYFVGDDYQAFHPVHASVLDQALPSGPRSGFLAAPGDASGQQPLAPEPIEQPWVETDPTVTVRPGERVLLTMLMDPSLAVHATSGILPRKSIALMRDWTADPLSRLAPSFRMGPVLVDPAEVSMPLAFGLPTEQLWSRRADAYNWRDDPILAATTDAGLPEASPVAQEGYIRAKPEDSGGGGESAA